MYAIEVTKCNTFLIVDWLAFLYINRCFGAQNLAFRAFQASMVHPNGKSLIPNSIKEHGGRHV